jgi:hypothetical protein
MSCAHDGFHSLMSEYDPGGGELVYFWTCEACTAKLAEARRETYRPRFDPRGNDPYLRHTPEQSD